MIQDAIVTCYNRVADPKATRCWYNLKKTQGYELEQVQGWASSVMLEPWTGTRNSGRGFSKSSSTGWGDSAEFIPGGRDGMTYGDIPVAPLIFQDDLIHTAERLKEARLDNKKMDEVICKLNLCLNQDKSVCLVIGSKKQIQDVWLWLANNIYSCFFLIFFYFYI